MNKRVLEIQRDIAKTLNGLPGVFSTVQWGGRAYKLPGPNGSLKKPKLLAHVCLSRDGEFVDLGFRLEPARARQAIKKFTWLRPHPFRTLAPSGWVVAEIRTKPQAKLLSKLLTESRALHPLAAVSTASGGKGKRSRLSENESVTKRIEAVMRAKRAAGWTPPADRPD